VTASLRALLSEIVDYAGLFPPAALPMAEAATLYARHRRSSRRWMLARFICPAFRLDEFEEAAALHLGESDERWPLSLLGRPGDDDAGFLRALGEDLERTAALLSHRGSRLSADVWETKLPETAERGESTLRRLLERTQAGVSRRDLGISTIFLEVPSSDPARVAETAGVLARHNGEGGPLRAGLKLRTGGVTATAFPSPAEVAYFLLAAFHAGVPMKATAGLHHPVRRFAGEVDTKMHGFLNLFGGAALARAHGWGTGELIEILEEEDPSRFRLDEDGLEWSGHRVDPAGLRDTRTQLALSFGSCSFDEPVEDLLALGLLGSP
jgi:hypothetical protein